MAYRIICKTQTTRLEFQVEEDIQVTGEPVIVIEPVEPTLPPGATPSPDPDPVPDPTPEPEVPVVVPPVGVVFETNFSADTGYLLTGGSLWNPANLPPSGDFDGAKAGGESSISCVAGAGVAGSNAMRIIYNVDTAQPTVSLGKHLTGDLNAGYDELYIRYNIKLPAEFRAGDGISSNVPYWKWMRLWQNTAPAQGATWTENRSDSGWFVFQPTGSTAANWGLKMQGIFAANPLSSNSTSGSSGGYKANYIWYNGQPADKDYSDYPGMMNRIWDIDWTVGANYGKQKVVDDTYHTVEVHVKMATAEGANDGVFEIWFDGVLQVTENTTPWQTQYDVDNFGDITGMPTVSQGGWNWITFFDNMAYWNGTTKEATGLYINDLVVSTDRIGHTYTI